MLIRVDELEIGKPKRIAIKGSEDWLSPIYEQFRSAPRQEVPVLTGNLSVNLLDACIQVEGEYTFSPSVKCSRCSASMNWPIHERLDLYFSLQADDLSARERDLTAKDLDDYFLLDNQVDLESVLNESVQLSLPLRLKCDQCKAKSEDDVVYSSDKEGQESLHPFAKLRELKLSD
ncbi:MAG: DUF177 domain-containing protein [Oligoflexales bacterium]|nr:DUF177 domain-containing protein [Oligoflexales bacterium]